jgi:hypothetical protein
MEDGLTSRGAGERRYGGELSCDGVDGGVGFGGDGNIS